MNVHHAKVRKRIEFYIYMQEIKNHNEQERKNQMPDKATSRSHKLVSAEIVQCKKTTAAKNMFDFHHHFNAQNSN